MWSQKFRGQYAAGKNPKKDEQKIYTLRRKNPEHGHTYEHYIEFSRVFGDRINVKFWDGKEQVMEVADARKHWNVFVQDGWEPYTRKERPERKRLKKQRSKKAMTDFDPMKKTIGKMSKVKNYNYALEA